MIYGLAAVFLGMAIVFLGVAVTWGIWWPWVFVVLNGLLFGLNMMRYSATEEKRGD